MATCVSCHRLNGAGNEFGPDLTKLDPKQTPADLLRNILEPSAKINEKYTSYLFETENGKVVTGLIVEETPDVVKVVENPLASTEPKVLKKSEIAGRKKSPTSIMPKGLLDKLTREEILDLARLHRRRRRPRTTRCSRETTPRGMELEGDIDKDTVPRSGSFSGVL